MPRRMEERGRLLLKLAARPQGVAAAEATMVLRREYPGTRITSRDVGTALGTYASCGRLRVTYELNAAGRRIRRFHAVQGTHGAAQEPGGEAEARRSTWDASALLSHWSPGAPMAPGRRR